MGNWDRSYTKQAEQGLRVLGWTKKDLANQFGLAPSSVYNWGDLWPLYAIRYIEKCLALRDTMIELERLRRMTKTAVDGFKGIDRLADHLAQMGDYSPE